MLFSFPVLVFYNIIINRTYVPVKEYVEIGGVIFRLTPVGDTFFTLQGRVRFSVFMERNRRDSMEIPS